MKVSQLPRPAPNLDRFKKRRKNPNAKSRYRLLPLIIGMTYLVATFLMFLLWPINWPITSQEELRGTALFVGLCFVAIFVGFAAGQGGAARQGSLRSWKVVYYTGAALSLLLVVPLTEIETGRHVTEVLDAMRNQKEAYLLLQSRLQTGAARSVGASLLSALAAPFIFAVTPLAIIRWRELTWLLRLMFSATIISSMTLSIMRGTDREVANLFIVSGAAFLVAYVRAYRQDPIKGGHIWKYWKQVVLIVLFILIGSAVTTSRKAERLGGVQVACVGGTHICADYDAPIISLLSDRQKFGLSIFIISTSQGYYGLDLALQKDFRSTYGIGHAPPLVTLYTMVTGDSLLPQKTYTFRNSVDGWSDQNYWSTMVTWWANDVGFPGAVVVLFLLALIWGKSWRDATGGFDDRAAILFCVMMEVIAYFPANNQVFLTFDGYFTFIFWLFTWVFANRYTRQRVPVNSSGASRLALSGVS